MNNFYNDDEEQDSLFGPIKREKSWLTGSYDFSGTPYKAYGRAAGAEAAAEYHQQEIFDTADLLMSIPRAVEGAVQGIYGLADMATFDALPDYDDEDRILGTSKTMVGGLSEGLLQFLLPFGALGTAGKLGKLGRVGKWLSKDTLASELARGGIVDFAVFEGSDGRLSDMLAGTAYENTVSSYLATDMDDSEFEGRLKNLAEGGLLGVPLDMLFRSAKMAKTYKVGRQGGLTQVEAAINAAGIAEDLWETVIDKKSMADAEAIRLGRGEAINGEAKPFDRTLDPETRDLAVEAGAGEIDAEVWRGSVNELLQDTKVADGFTGQARQAVVDMVGLIGERNFDDVSVALGGASTEAGATASFNYLKRVVTVFGDSLRAGTVRNDIMHELWHSLEQSLGEKQRRKITREFLSQREAYLRANPEAMGRFERLREADDVQRASILDEIVAKDEYQYVSPAEWWSYHGTLATQKRLDLLKTVQDGGVRGLLAQTNMMWSDFVSTMRRMFGAGRTDDILNSYLRGRAGAANSTISRLQSLGNIFGVETAYARQFFKVTDTDADSIKQALDAGKQAGLSGIDLAASVPYPKILNGFDSDAQAAFSLPKLGRSADAAPVKVAEGVKGDNIIYALVRYANATKDEAKDKIFAEEYLGSIGIVPTKEAVDKLVELVNLKKRTLEAARKAVKGTDKVEGGRAKSTAKGGTLDESGVMLSKEDAAGLRDLMEDGQATGYQTGGSAEVITDINKIKKEIKKADADLEASGLTGEELIKWRAESRYSLSNGNIDIVSKFLDIQVTKNAISSDKAKEILDALDSSKAKPDNAKAAQVGTDRTEASKLGTVLTLTEEEVKLILSKVGIKEPELTIGSGGSSYSTTVSDTRLSDIAKQLSDKESKAMEALKKFGPEAPQTRAAQQAARKVKLQYDRVAMRISEESAGAAPKIEKPVTEAKPAEAAKAITPEIEAEIKKLPENKRIASLEKEVAADKEELAELASKDFENLRRDERAAAKAEARNRMTELRKMIRTNEEQLGVARQALAEKVEQLKAAATPEPVAAEAAPLPEPTPAAIPEPTPEPTVSVVETNSGPQTANAFPTTAKNRTTKESAARTRRRAKTESTVSKAVDAVVSGEEPKTEIEVAVKQHLEANPQVAERVADSAVARGEVVEEVADAIEAAAVKPPDAAKIQFLADLQAKLDNLLGISRRMDLDDPNYNITEIEIQLLKSDMKLAKADNADLSKLKSATAQDAASKAKLVKDADLISSRNAAMQPEAIEVDEVVEGRAEVAPAAAPQPSAAAFDDFKLPRDLSGSTPRYGSETLTFARDIDKVAYILAGAKPSKSEAKFKAALAAAGIDVEQVVAHGQRIKQALKDTKDTTIVEKPMNFDDSGKYSPPATVTPPTTPPPAKPTTPTPSGAGGGGKPPATPPTPTPSPAPGGRSRRTPEQIGELVAKGKKLGREDAEDLIYWWENNPATIGPEGVNPRAQSPEQLAEAWLMSNMGMLNLSRMDITRTEASFLRVMERFIVGRDLAAKGLTNKNLDTYSLAAMRKDGLDRIAEETGISTYDLATHLRARAKTLVELRAEILHGKLMLIKSGSDIVKELDIMAPRFADGSVTNEELLMTLVRAVGHGELIGAVGSVSSEAGRLLTSLRIKLDESLAVGVKIAPPTGPTPTPSPVATPSGAPSASPVPATPTATSTASTATPRKPKSAAFTPASAMPGYSEEMAAKLDYLRQQYGEDGLKNILEQLGGREKVMETLDKYKSVIEEKVARGESVGPIVSKMAKAVKMVGFWDFHNEWWINGLISSSSTWAGVALTANSMTMMLRPVEQILGGAIARATGDTNGLRAMQVGLNAYAGMTRAFLESFTLAPSKGGPSLVEGSALDITRRAFKSERPIGTGSPFDVKSNQAWTSKNLPGIRKGALQSAYKKGLSGDAAKNYARDSEASADFLLGFIRLPQRLVLTGDEFFKQLNYRGQLYARVQESLKANGVVGPEAASRLKEAMDMAIVDGEFISNRRLLAEGQAAARAALPTGSAKEIKKFAEDYRNAQWAKASAIVGAGETDKYNFQGMSDAALAAAKEDTMQADPRFSWQKTVNRAVAEHKSLRLFLPFVTTPINSLIYAGDRFPGNHVLEYTRQKLGESFTRKATKLGFPEFVAKFGSNQETRLYKELTSPDPIVKAEAVGRAVTGTALFAAGFSLAAGGTVTGYGPRNRDERKTWMTAGFQPYSFKIGDTWYAYNRLDPFSTMLGTLADLSLAMKYTHLENENAELTESAVASVWYALVNNLSNKSYLQGVSTAIDMLSQQDPEVAKKWVARHIGTLVPYSSQLRSLTDYTDDYKRINDPEIFDGIVSSVFNQIPGLSDNNLPARDMFGRPIKRTDRFFIDLFSPINTAPVQDDALRNELINLGTAFRPLHYMAEGIDLRRVDLPDGRNAHDKFQEIFSETLVRGKNLEEALTDLVKSDRYTRLSPMSSDFVQSPRVSEIRTEMSKYRMLAWREMLRKYPSLRNSVETIKRQKAAAQRGEAPTKLGIYDNE